MLGRLGSIVGTLRDSDLRWGPGDRVAFDTTLAQLLARRRTILGPSRVSAVNGSPKHQVETKNFTRLHGTVSAARSQSNALRTKPCLSHSRE